MGLAITFWLNDNHSFHSVSIDSPVYYLKFNWWLREDILNIRTVMVMVHPVSRPQ